MNRLLPFLLFAFFAGAHPALAGASEEIRAALERWTEDFNAGNRDAVCDLFDRELIADFRGQPERNYDGLCALLQRSLDDTSPKYKYSLEIKEIIPAADLAVVRVEWRLDISPSHVTSVEAGLDIFRRSRDGRWRIIRYMGYEAP